LGGNNIIRVKPGEGLPEKTAALVEDGIDDKGVDPKTYVKILDGLLSLTVFWRCVFDCSLNH
jgi:hypothetical protein